MTKNERVLERDFQKQVIDLAKTFGWKVAHFRTAQSQKGHWLTPVQADGKGFPDLVMVKGRRLIFAELKSQRGQLSAEQGDWLSKLALLEWGTIDEPGIHVRVWRPDDWTDIVNELRRTA